MKAYYKADLIEYILSNPEGLNRVLIADLPNGGLVRDGVTETISQQYWVAINDVGAGPDEFKLGLKAQLARHLGVPMTEGLPARPGEEVTTNENAEVVNWPETLREWLGAAPSVRDFIPSEKEIEVLCEVKNDRTQRCYIVPVHDGLMLYSKAVNLGAQPTADELFKASALAAKNQYKFAMGIENVGGEWELRVGTHMHSQNISRELAIFKVGWVAAIADYLEHVYQGTDEF